jgi:hypothetical protein
MGHEGQGAFCYRPIIREVGLLHEALGDLHGAVS